MTSVFVVSTETYTGKTALITGLMDRLGRSGLRTGYLKPVSVTPGTARRRLADRDAQFMKQTFGLETSLSTIVPVKLTASVIEKALKGEVNLPAKVERAFHRISKVVDALIIEGTGNLAEGHLFSLSSPEIAERLNLPVLVMCRYTGRLTGDDVLLAQRVFGDRIIGAVINAVPPREMDPVSDSLVPTLEGRGIPVLGLIPRQRLLTAASVRELADGINGEILIGEEYTEELVENLMIGAMGVDNALAHFRRKPNKAVITGGDRSDIHLAALQTSTRCLILTGNLYPSQLIISRAEEQGVPIILSPQSTLETIETINQFFGRTRFHQPQKLAQFLQLLESHFNFKMLFEILKLPS